MPLRAHRSDPPDPNEMLFASHGDSALTAVRSECSMEMVRLTGVAELSWQLLFLA
jgi:hypothetical protein